jgi:hypothetical protein
MKQSVNPIAVIAAIVVVVAIACFFGIRALNPPTDFNPNATSKTMTADQKSMYDQMSKPKANNNQGGSGGYKPPSSSGQ